MDWWIALKLPGADDLAYLDSQDADKLGEQARFRQAPMQPLISNKQMSVVPVCIQILLVF